MWIFITKFIAFPCILTSESWSRRKRHSAIKPCHTNGAGPEAVSHCWNLISKKSSGNKGDGTKQRPQIVNGVINGRKERTWKKICLIQEQFKNFMNIWFQSITVLILLQCHTYKPSNEQRTESGLDKPLRNAKITLTKVRCPRLWPRPREWLGDLVSEIFRSLPQIMGPVFKILSSLLTPVVVDAPVPTVFILDFHIVLETHSIQR